MHKNTLTTSDSLGIANRPPVGWPVLLASAVGLTAFLYPFLLPALEPTAEHRTRSGDAPILFAIVTVLALLAAALDLDAGQRRQSSLSPAKTVALLGALVAIDAALRLVPTFLGASPIFFLIIITGYVFGPSVGFQMGTLTLLVSAFITGGIGPWLPFQMLGAGWVGLTAGWLPHLARPWQRIVILAIFGAGWGLLYGALLNLWSWPFTAPGITVDAGLYWNPALSFQETLHHYGRFYLVTSLWYDLLRSAANVLLIVILGPPLIATLERYHRRFSWTPWHEPATLAPEPAPPA